MVPDLLQTKSQSQDTVDELCDDLGFAATDIEEANGHKDAADGYVQEVE